MARVTDEIERTHTFHLTQSFSRAQDDPPLGKKKFNMHNVGLVTHTEWLNAAVSVGRGIGMDDIYVKVDEKSDQITYRFYFNDLAESARLLVALEGLVVKPKGYTLSIGLGTLSPDEKIEDYYDALSSFCDSRAIAHQISHVKNGDVRQVHVAFDRNVDYYAAKLALQPGGAIDTHLQLLAQQRQQEELTSDMVETLKLEDKRGWPYVNGDVMRNPTLERQG